MLLIQVLLLSHVIRSGGGLVSCHPPPRFLYSRPDRTALAADHRPTAPPLEERRYARRISSHSAGFVGRAMCLLSLRREKVYKVSFVFDTELRIVRFQVISHFVARQPVAALERVGNAGVLFPKVVAGP